MGSGEQNSIVSTLAELCGRISALFILFVTNSLNGFVGHIFGIYLERVEYTLLSIFVDMGNSGNLGVERFYWIMLWNVTLQDKHCNKRLR